MSVCSYSMIVRWITKANVSLLSFRLSESLGTKKDFHTIYIVRRTFDSVTDPSQLQNFFCILMCIPSAERNNGHPRGHEYHAHCRAGLCEDVRHSYFQRKLITDDGNSKKTQAPILSRSECYILAILLSLVLAWILDGAEVFYHTVHLEQDHQWLVTRTLSTEGQGHFHCED